MTSKEQLLESIDANYETLRTRLCVHLDWYLHSRLSPEGEDRTWTLQEIQEKLRAATGIKTRKSTILQRNARLFQQYQCSPLRLVEHDKYALDLIYYQIAGEKVRPPQIGRGRPRKEFTETDNELEVKTRRERNKQYARLYRHPEILAKVFEGVHEADLDYISSKISKLADGIHFRKKTIESAIKKYIEGLEAGTIRGPPIQEDPDRSGYYRELESIE